MDFTNAQLEAICCRGSSVLVSAGAGSGKTRVLTERLMEYMDPQQSDARPEDIDRFLVITFTRAAAGELRARITDAIAARLRSDPHNAHLRRQNLLCRNAQIGTIHSFCASILREYAGVDPQTGREQFVAEDGGESLLLFFLKNPEANPAPLHLRLKGLEPHARYRLDSRAFFGCRNPIPEPPRTAFTGAALMRAGLTLPPMLGDYPSARLLFVRE